MHAHTLSLSYTLSLCSQALWIQSGVRIGVPMHTANYTIRKKQKRKEELENDSARIKLGPDALYIST